jgi:hypothetical protein
MAQEATFEQRQVMDSVAVLLGRYGRPGDSTWVVKSFATKHIYFKVGTETGVDRRDNIFVNAALGDQVRTRDATARYRAIADLAATLLHERVHVRQPHAAQGASRLRNAAGGDHPSEVEAWRVGFQTYRDFIAIETIALREATSEQDREQTAIRMRELLRSFEHYRTEYERPGNHFGDMQFGDGLTLADVSAAHAARITELDRLLERADFRTTVSPYRVVVTPGERFTITAATVGGAFNEARRKGQTALYSYLWFADGVRLEGSSATLKRTARRAEVITVVAVDRLGAKSSVGRCEVVLAAPASTTDAPAGSAVDAVASPTVPTGATAKPATPSTAGRWVRVSVERVDKVLDPTRVRNHSFSDGSYTAEVLYPRQPEATNERASWAIPGGTLTPGSEFAMSVSGAANMQVVVTRGNPYTEAVSTEAQPGVWKVSGGSGADRAFITVRAGGRFVQCWMTYVYEWRQ